MKKYKLIKLYPGSPKLGYTTFEDNDYDHPNNFVDFPEFWEEIIEFEILSFNEHAGSNILTKGNFKKHCPWENFNDLLRSGWHSINSVKRLSDGEIFTIGDKINEEDALGPIQISNIRISNGLMLLSEKTCTITLNGAKHVRVPLFRTEDGIDIYEGDKVYRVFEHTYNYIPHNFEKAFLKWIYLHKAEHWFANEDKAKEYVIMNKPCLSYQDMMGHFSEYFAVNTTELKQLIEKKLKQ